MDVKWWREMTYFINAKFASDPRSVEVDLACRRLQVGESFFGVSGELQVSTLARRLMCSVKSRRAAYLTTICRVAVKKLEGCVGWSPLY